ncbi:Pfs NACHT and ankyrin domain protein [Penicillium angulare]|uniref:Pfs NACHT and ankyrin domain protein n=1 Tax=Penicillium angulare TaxID=116970 RepID=UPI002540C786|nr:Pfs NACHT and ankyrin domain protein [Penicillium angulare]KAJ5266925.1 Pfs NACHT and ankyrin domain protein [Penicillium angulare]
MASFPPRSPFPNDQYTVGWICALPIELAAAQGMLDEEHGAPHTLQARIDGNSYLLGRIGRVKVVIVCLPADYIGSVSAAIVARNMLHTFRGIRFCLLVGIGAGIPSDERDIRLGDVVISDGETSGGIVVHDFGKRVADGSFEHTNPRFNRKSSSLMSNAMSMLKTEHSRRQNYIQGYIDAMLQKSPRLLRFGFSRPAQSTDRLFSTHYMHSTGRTCDRCDPRKEVTRRRRYDEKPVVHYGVIATGGAVVKHAPTREHLRHKFSAICLEMEAEGVIRSFPCIVIRGISDYADSHKNDHWHPYAAAAAAGCAKELLGQVAPER